MDSAIAGEQRHAMNHACGRDQLIRRVPPEVKAGGYARDREVERPDPKGREYLSDFPVVEVHVDASVLGQLRELPENDGGDSPLVSGQKNPLSRSQVSREGEDQDVGVKV